MSTGVLIGAVNLNGPGRYLHWSIFTVSEANLVLIAVMVVIFGAALLVRFPDTLAMTSHEPQGGTADEATAAAPIFPLPSDLGDDADAAMWTARLRRRALRVLPPGKLLPDRQPAYVASWIYVFGVASLATLGVVIVSGLRYRPGRPRLVAHRPVGHFFNSLHLWSVEAFMAFLVIHLWGKFWMAAWRGRTGADLDHRVWWPSWPRSWSVSPATCPSRTSTPSGSPPAARTPSTPLVSGPSSTS